MAFILPQRIVGEYPTTATFNGVVTWNRPCKEKRVNRPAEDRLLNRDVVLVMLATFCFMTSNMLVSPLMAGFSASLGAGGAVMGLAAAAMNIVSLFCRPIAGNLSDHISKRTIVGVGACLYLISSVWYSLASSEASLIAARMVNGIGFACCSVCLAAWMATLLPIRHMGAGMGLYGTMNALAMAVGPAVGIKSQQLVGYRPTFLISTVMATLMVVSVTFVRNGGHPFRGKQTEAKTGERHRFSLRSIVEPRVVPLSLVFMCFAIPYFANQSFLVEYAQARDTAADVSLFFPLYAVALLILRVTCRHWFDTKPFRLFFIIGSITLTGMLLCMAALTNNWILLVAAVLTATSYGMMSSVTQAEAVVIAGKERSGVANATYYMGIDLGMSLGPLLGGVIYGALPIAWLYPIFIIMMPLAWIIYISTARYVTGTNR